ncbi:hypothetical protein FNH22_17885 [Fulvivirga sp. M361]|uniref:hypothetical protein n=1 Tax=Fulvivirga sp. M361 TaxID=2594266 RepID=UPI00117B1261|nr:hypothetical protein [Fulvivirga sp. M361]TRX56032.1 hypothetical protein FNH22_17885 [Fulvivirga sp. M361]
MKNIFLIIALFGGILLGCDHDDFGVANTLDSPAFNLSADKTELTTGETATVSILVTDAPGKIDSIAVSVTNDFGIIDIDEASLNAVRGQTTGTINLNYTAPEDNIGSISLTVTLFDQQNFLINAQASETQSQSFTTSISFEVAYISAAPSFTVETDSDTLFSGETTPLTIEVTDAPGGGIDQIIVTADAGTVELDEASLAAALGQTNATITGTYQVGDLGSTGEVGISVTVVDRIQKRSGSASAEVFGICPAAEDVAGAYDVFVSGQLGGDAGPAYDALNASVNITKLNDGQFMIDDMSFGVYDALYTDRVAPSGKLNICGDTIIGTGDKDEDDRTFTINGTLPADGNLNGAIRIVWSNSFGDQGTAILTLD